MSVCPAPEPVSPRSRAGSTSGSFDEAEHEKYAFIPKEETRASEFLRAFPECDGRGVVVGVLDTGIDPRAPGLQQTSTGRPKLLDLHDCSGAGDVDTSLVAHVRDSLLVGRTGRQLRLKIDDGPVHCGAVDLFALMPAALVMRLKTIRKARFHSAQRGMKAHVSAEVYAALCEHEKSLRATDDVGPVCDVIAFERNGEWRVMVDFLGFGDLTSATPIRAYNVAHETLHYDADGASLTFSVHVHSHGNIVELVTTAGAHGTHVASILGAYHGIGDMRNGVAPGVQLISLKVADTRLGTMETAPALIRALSIAQHTKCDILNISYGEQVSEAHVGAVVDAIKMCVASGVHIVVSAGNDGPALGSLAAPACIPGTIAVGALLTPALIRASHALPDSEIPPHAHLYAWSARGPSLDGSKGIDIVAPGCALSSVPAWTETGAQVMRGTSMASPNACGCVSLLLSAYAPRKPSPALIHRALTSTAKKLENLEPWAQGSGVIDCMSAHKALQAHIAMPEHVYRVVIGSKKFKASGIYYVQRKHEYPSIVAHVYTRLCGQGDAGKRHHQHLSIKSNADWIVAPRAITLTDGHERSLSLQFRPKALERGRAFCAELAAYSSRSPLPQFKIPVTFIRPIHVDSSVLRQTYRFEAGAVEHLFLAVPSGVGYWLSVHLRAPNSQRHPCRYIFCTRQQINDFAPYNRRLSPIAFSIAGGETERMNVPVTSGAAVEICVASFVPQLKYSVTYLKVSITLHKLSPGSLAPSILFGTEPLALALNSGLRREQLRPSAYISVVQWRISSFETNFIDFTEHRSLLRFGRGDEHGATLIYRFSLAGGTYRLSFPGIDSFLYDSTYDAQYWQLYSVPSNALIARGDFRPASFQLGGSSRSDYFLRLLLRSRTHKALKNAKNIALLVEQHLAPRKQIRLHLHPSLGEATNCMVSSKLCHHRVAELTIPPHSSMNLVLSCPPLSKKYGKGTILIGFLDALTNSSNSPAAVPDTGLLFPAGSIPVTLIPNKHPKKLRNGMPPLEGKEDGNSRPAASATSHREAKHKLDSLAYLSLCKSCAAEEFMETFKVYHELFGGESHAKLSSRIRIAERRISGDIAATIALIRSELKKYHVPEKWVREEELAVFQRLGHVAAHWLDLCHRRLFIVYRDTLQSF